MYFFYFPVIFCHFSFLRFSLTDLKYHYIKLLIKDGTENDSSNWEKNQGENQDLKDHIVEVSKFTCSKNQRVDGILHHLQGYINLLLLGSLQTARIQGYRAPTQ